MFLYTAALLRYWALPVSHRFMVARVGHLATIRCKPRQARKGATVAADSCAGARRARAATYLFHCPNLPVKTHRFLFFGCVINPVLR